MRTTADGRPVWLDLARIRLPLPALASIAHRVSGVVLFLVLPVLTGVWSWSLTDTGFAALRAGLEGPWGTLALFLLAWAWWHHFCAGLRHLGLDLHLGLSLTIARRSAALALAGGLVLALVSLVALGRT